MIWGRGFRFSTLQKEGLDFEMYLSLKTLCCQFVVWLHVDYRNIFKHHVCLLLFLNFKNKIFNVFFSTSNYYGHGSSNLRLIVCKSRLFFTKLDSVDEKMLKLSKE